MGRKFTDNEVRAYTKNRHEEKILRERIQKLNEGFGVHRDITSKERVHLLAENKDCRLTTGITPTPPETAATADTVHISECMKRPWAYSINETTYNCVYQKSAVPYTSDKRGISKWTYSTKSEQTSLSDFENAWKRNSYRSGRSPELFPCSRTPASNGSIRSLSRSRPLLHSRVSSADCNVRNPLTTCISQNIPISENKIISTSPIQTHPSVRDDPAINDVGRDEHTSNKALPTDVHENNPRLSGSRPSLFVLKTDENDPNYRPYATVLSLPRVYEIDMEDSDYQKRRKLSRAKSSVSFNLTMAQTATQNASCTEHVIGKERANPTYSTNSVEEHIERAETQISTTDDIEQSAESDSAPVVSNENVAKYHAKTNVFYKGVLLRNYIHPQDRYKLDPLVVKRRQSKMDRLVKESVVFLKRVNHENIRIDIAFPRSARQRLLNKLVEENNTHDTKVDFNQDDDDLHSKIEKFMCSISKNCSPSSSI